MMPGLKGLNIYLQTWKEKDGQGCEIDILYLVSKREQSKEP